MINTQPPPAKAPTPRPGSQLLHNLLQDLWRFKFIVPAVAALVASAVGFYTSRQPRVYEATTTLEYDPHPTQPMGTAIEDTSSESTYWDTYEFYETQNYILTSRALAERVVRKLGLHHDPEFTGEQPDAQGNLPNMPVEQAAEMVLGTLSVTHIPDTRIVRISVKDGSQDRAQLIANAMSDSYIEKTLEDRLGTSARALDWLGGQMENLKHELEASELALYRFREEHQSLSASLQERQKIIATQLDSYNQTLTDIRTRRIQTDARLSTLRDLLAATDEPLGIQAGPVAADQVVLELRSKARAAASALEKLAVTYGPAHPQVQTAQAELDAYRDQLQKQIDAIIQGVEADLTELSRAERGIETALGQVNQQGLELSLQEVEYSRLDRERNSKVELYALVMQRAAQTDLTRALRVANGRVLDRALRPTHAISPKVRSSVMSGLFVGVVLGVIMALGIGQLDNKVRSVGDLEQRGVTVLGVVPSVESSSSSSASARRIRRRTGGRIEDAHRDLIVHHEPRSTAAECCRTIRTNLTFQSADRPLRAFSVTSAMPRDGKTTISINLAITIAQSGKRVLIVDTDLRKPRLHRAFQVPVGAGVTSVIAGEATLEEAVLATDIPGLSLLQCGPIPPNPSELLHTRRFSDLIQAARDAYDLVIFDTPPLGAVTDPAIISTLMDGVVVVIRARGTTRHGVDVALRQLHSVSARIIGAILNDVDLNERAYGAYYSYYRGYYAEEETPSPPTSGTKTTATRA